MLIKENTIESKYINIYDLQSEKIGIPIFQRFYSWKKKEIAQFKKDLLQIIDDKNAQLYLLDFIYYEENNKIMLADGQQRIVTLNNLIKAIRDVSAELHVSTDPIDYFDITYDVFSNQQKYEKHMTKYATSPFKIVYLDFCDFVKNNINRVNDIVNVLKHNIFIYIKKCNNADDAFDIFQQINTGGKPLTKDEVIKTALDQYSQAFGVKYDTSIIKDVRQSLISFYKLKMPVFDKNFDNMEIITFLRDYVTKDRNTFQDYVDSVNLLNTNSNNPIRYVINYIKRSSLMDVLNILAMNRVDINKDTNYLQKVIIPLCMMSVVLTLNGGSPTLYRYLLIDVVNCIKRRESADNINYILVKKINNDPTTWKIPFSIFSQKLGDINTDKNLKKALLILDVICKNISGTVNVDKINLEHIYPQNPDFEWARNGWPSHSEKQKELIDNIGNYLLLCESVNKSIQNQYITRKTAQYQSVITKDILLQTPVNTIDFLSFESDREKYIYERQQNIAKLLQSDLPLGKVLIT